MENLVSPHPHSDDPVLPQWQRRLDDLMSAVLPAALHRIIRFSMAGLAATFFYFVLANVFVLGAGLEPTTASVSAYLTALALSYLLQSTFAFRVAGHSAAQITRFTLTSAAGLIISFGTMWLVTEVLEQPYIYGALAVCVLIPAVNFIAFSRWVFSESAPHSRDE
jgi:putative flippase GtrA